jgi:NAD(P)-dependent dehydrogenase (short-subunit alcohol dehydrogenase family)
MSDEGTVAVITGGAGGMGLATAKLLGRQHRVVISDVAQRLAAAADELRTAGVEVLAITCDVTDRRSVEELAQRAAAWGRVVAVVHTAGVSPQMGDADTIVRINALGTVNVTSAFLSLAGEGFRLVNVASMAAHLSPKALMPQRAYRYATTDPEVFMAKVMRRVRFAPKAQRSAIAYPISKHFVVWFSRAMAAEYGAKSARIVSVSPGSIDTAMGRLEEAHGAGAILKFSALKRFGTVEEVAEVLAFCAGEKAGYLTGTDVLCDGGVVAGIRWKDLLSMSR